MGTQRGAGRFYFNPALAGYPTGDRGFILAGNGRRAIAGHACAAGVSCLHPNQRVSRVTSLLRAENGFRLAQLNLQDFHRQPVSGLYCQSHRQLMRLEKLLRENSVTVYEADVRPPERYLMERFITSPFGWMAIGITTR